jgi:hypothetical protein
MSSLEGFAVLSDSYKDPETFKFISETCRERYSAYKKAHHVWINEIETGKFRDTLETVRQNRAILSAIKTKFPGFIIQPVTESDEVYWSASPKDALGSDRALVDCHYDAPFGVIPTGGVVYYRVIIAMNENNTVTTIFPDEDKKVKMNTGDFHGLDYNKDWHCVDGTIPANKHRVLLKLHYLVIPQNCQKMWIDWVRFLNVNWTYLSRATMRMSADPKTPIEQLVGIFVNVCRFIFNHITSFAAFVGLFFLVVFIIVKKKLITL